MRRSRRPRTAAAEILEAARELLPALLLVRATGTASAAENGEGRRRPVTLSDLDQNCVAKRVVVRLLRAGLMERDGAGNLCLSNAGSVLGESLLVSLDQAGFALQYHEGSPRHIPHWDGERRILYFRGMMVKHLRRTAPNQEAILNAFQGAGWPPQIPNPLPPKERLIAGERIHEALRRLNHRLPLPLRFARDGAAEGVRWIEIPAVAEKVAPTRRAGFAADRPFHAPRV